MKLNCFHLIGTVLKAIHVKLFRNYIYMSLPVIDALTDMEVAECASSNANPCLNGGNCVNNAAGDYVCACVDGRGGARCEKGKEGRLCIVFCS